MSQNKAPRTEPSKPHIYHYPTRNVSFLRVFLSLQDAKGISLYTHITQKRKTSPGASYKRKTGVGNGIIPKTNCPDCKPIATGVGRYPKEVRDRGQECLYLS